MKVDGELGVFYYAVSVFRIASLRIGNRNRNLQSAEEKKKKKLCENADDPYFVGPAAHFVRVYEDVLVMRTILILNPGLPTGLHSVYTAHTHNSISRQKQTRFLVNGTVICILTIKVRSN